MAEVSSVHVPLVLSGSYTLNEEHFRISGHCKAFCAYIGISIFKTEP